MGSDVWYRRILLLHPTFMGQNRTLVTMMLSGTCLRSTQVWLFTRLPCGWRHCGEGYMWLTQNDNGACMYSFVRYGPPSKHLAIPIFGGALFVLDYSHGTEPLQTVRMPAKA
ncbi:hypothetical protein OK016_21515 [Vibrio chagasii]|nr:hypothetical protein [Vibrio chagasii]